MAEDTKSDNRLTYLLVGSALGAAVGLLIAPKSGRETREELITKFREGKETLQNDVKSAQEQLTKAKEKFETEAQRLLSKGKELIGREEDSVAAAIDAVKEAYLKEKESWTLRNS
jgi:gas vesicle protein